MNREKLLFECCRRLLAQIETEQALRVNLLSLWMKGEYEAKTSSALPTNEEVEVRISELKEEIERNLTNHNTGSGIF